MNSNLSESVCIITGSSSGIGRATALLLAKHGATVVINYKQNQIAAEEVIAEITQEKGHALAVQADVTSIEGAKLLIDSTHNQFGRIDILINNFGPFLMKTIEDTTFDEWHEIVQGNLHSAFYCTKFALSFMREQKEGHVIFIGAPKADSLRSRHNACAYGIAKTGVVLLAKTLAREEGQHGIRANAVNPGIIDTGSIAEEMRSEVQRQPASGRIGTPEDIAQALLYLLSAQAGYCNGAVLDVDGGLWL